MNELKTDIENSIDQIKFIRNRHRALIEEGQRIEKMIQSAKDTKEEKRIMEQLLGQRYQIHMEKIKTSEELNDEEDNLEYLGEKLKKLKKQIHIEENGKTQVSPKKEQSKIQQEQTNEPE